VIFGTVYDETLGDQLRVTVIATGLSPARRQQPTISVVHTSSVQRTGTDNLPVLDNALSPMAITAQSMGLHGGTDFRSMNTPSVWRTRTAAAKVDALASNGMDEIEIPAFLRKQAD
jgi:cell division protein FtsZ